MELKNAESDHVIPDPPPTRGALLRYILSSESTRLAFWLLLSSGVIHWFVA